MRRDLNIGTTWLLPEWSAGPRGDELEVLEVAKAAGYQGIQGADAGRCRELGLVPTTSDIRPTPGGLTEAARRWFDQGYECATLMVGTGLEDDDAADRLVDEVLSASSTTGLPLYIETHRATITQDLWRTLRLVDRHPEMRFNGDFSHWYVSHDFGMVDFIALLETLRPVLERVRYLHGRIASSGCIQIEVQASNASAAPVSHFRQLWQLSFEAFLTAARNEDELEPCSSFGFAPELLPSEFGYAQLVDDGAGNLTEGSDRWEQALILCDIAEECFGAAASKVVET